MVQTVYKSLTAGLLVLMLILALAGGIPQPDTSEAPAPVAAAVDAVIGEPGIAEAHSGHICGPRYAIHFTWRARAYERVVGYGSSFFGHWAVIENWEYAQHLGRFVRVDRFHRSGCRMVMR